MHTCAYLCILVHTCVYHTCVYHTFARAAARRRCGEALRAVLWGGVVGWCCGEALWGGAALRRGPVPQPTRWYHSALRGTTAPHGVPQSTKLYHSPPGGTTAPHRVPQSTKLYHSPPRGTTSPHGVPHPTTCTTAHQVVPQRTRRHAPSATLQTRAKHLPAPPSKHLQATKHLPPSTVLPAPPSLAKRQRASHAAQLRRAI